MPPRASRPGELDMLTAESSLAGQPHHQPPPQNSRPAPHQNLGPILVERHRRAVIAWASRSCPEPGPAALRSRPRWGRLAASFLPGARLSLLVGYGPALSFPSLTLWALSDGAGRAAETRCRKIRDLRAEAGRTRLNDFRQKGGLTEECSARIGSVRRVHPGGSPRSPLLKGVLARSNGVRIGSDLIGPLVSLEPILVALFKPAVSLVGLDPAIEEI